MSTLKRALLKLGSVSPIQMAVVREILTRKKSSLKNFRGVDRDNLLELADQYHHEANVYVRSLSKEIKRLAARVEGLELNQKSPALLREVISFCDTLNLASNSVGRFLALQQAWMEGRGKE